MFIKKTFKDSKFPDITKFANFWKKMRRTQGMCHVIYMFFVSSLGEA